jgi:hypothetical protein
MHSLKGGEKLMPVTNDQPKMIEEMVEINGILNSFEQTARTLLSCHIGPYHYLLPISLKPRLEKLVGKHIAVTLIRKKYYLRELKSSKASLSRDEPRDRPCTQ